MANVGATTQEPAARVDGGVAVARVGATEIVLGLVGLLLVVLLLQLMGRHTLWYDEAALLTNIADGSWGDLLGPLPFYDQAGPLLYLIVQKATHSLFGLNESLLRLPSWLAAATAVGIVARKLPGLDPLERACAAAVLAGGYMFAYLATEAKQYTVELLCSCVLMAYFQQTGGNGRTLLARLAVLLAAIVSASTMPLATFAVACASHLQGFRRARDVTRLVWPRVMAGGWIFAAAGLAYIVYYIGHIKPAYLATLGNFGFVYESFGFARGASYPLWLAAKVWQILESHFAIIGVAIGAVSLLGGFRLHGRATGYLAQLAALAGVVVALNLAGVYPIMQARFSLFLMPWLAVLAGAGIAWLITRIADRGLQMLAAAGATAIVMLPAVSSLLAPTEHQARRSVAHLRAVGAGTGKVAVMVTVSAQPVFDLYVAPARTSGDRCHAPGVLGYTNRCRALKASGDGLSFPGTAAKWYLMNYISIHGRGVDPVGFPGPSLEVFANGYLDWLAGQLPAAQPVLLFTAPRSSGDTDGAPLQARLKRVAGVERIVQEAVSADAPRSAAIDRVTRPSAK